MIPLMPFSAFAFYSEADDFFSKLAELYAEMDQAYDQAAAAYGFDCKGCSDNCCQTRFYHHTHIETAYLLSGFSRLEALRQEKVYRRSEEIVAAQRKNLPGADRLMCPVNMDGWCLLYAYRPMICRLHGLAHELHLPGKGKTFGSGCGEFEHLCGDQTYVPFDRTPFYTKMAALEQEFKTYAGIKTRLKKTVAEMIVDAATQPMEAPL